MGFAIRMEKWRRDLRRRSRSGSAAIEFAFIAPIFIIMLGGIIEGGWVALSQSVMMKATEDAARLVRTGQTQTMQQAAFRNALCADVSDIMTCSELQVDVRPYNGFTAPGSPIKNGQLDPTLNQYNVGGACDVVVVRTFYRWKILTPGLSIFLANAKSAAGAGSNDTRILSAAAAFRNEPFNTGMSGC